MGLEFLGFTNRGWSAGKGSGELSDESMMVGWSSCWEAVWILCTSYETLNAS